MGFCLWGLVPLKIARHHVRKSWTGLPAVYASVVRCLTHKFDFNLLSMGPRHILVMLHRLNDSKWLWMVHSPRYLPSPPLSLWWCAPSPLFEGSMCGNWDSRWHLNSCWRGYFYELWLKLLPCRESTAVHPVNDPLLFFEEHCLGTGCGCWLVGWWWAGGA